MFKSSHQSKYFNDCVGSLEAIHQQLEASLTHGGLDDSSLAVVTSLEHHFANVLKVEKTYLSLESMSGRQRAEVSMERIGELLSSAKDKAKKAAKHIWQRIVAMFQWIRKKIPFLNKKEEKIEQGVEAVKKAANSKGSTTPSKAGDGGADPMYLVKSNYAVKEKEGNNFQRRIEFALNNNRYSQEQIENLIEHCKKQRPNDFEEYMVDKFCLEITTDKSKWNKDMFQTSQSYLNHNFSIKRLDNLVDIRRHLVETGVIKSIDVTKSGKTDKAADGGSSNDTLTLIKQTLETIRAMSDEEKKEVARKIDNTDVKTAKSMYASQWSALVNGPKSEIVTGLNQAHDIVLAMTARIVDILTDLHSGLAIAVNSQIAWMYDSKGEDRKPVKDIENIGNKLIKFMEDFSTEKVKPSLPGLTISRKVDDPKRKRYLPHTVYHQSFSLPEQAEGDIIVLSLNEGTDITRRKTNAIASLAKINDQYAKIFDKIDVIIKKHGDSIDNHDAVAYYTWCYHWCIMLINTYKSLQRYHQHAINIHSEMTRNSIKSIMPKK